MSKNLAIIVPAYKGRFLDAALDSLARQSCKDFTCYIGDDCSPDDIRGISSRHAGRMDLVYRRFESNLGASDLVKHWERCIELASEPYILLFSDDDVLPYDIVERFVKTLGQYPSAELFRMQLAVIDGDGSLLKSTPPLSAGRADARSILCDKLYGKTATAACEYIFSAALYRRSGGFVHFPHAWCSDDASWFRMGVEAGGAVSLPGLPVLWRNVSGSNISDSHEYDRDKETATAQFLGHLYDCYPEIRDRSFARALYAYIKCILSVSLGRRCSKEGFSEISSALARFSALQAAKIRIKYGLRLSFGLAGYKFRP